MRRLYIVRHGDARQDAATDHARVLSAAGQAAVARLGAELARRPAAVDHALCSDAARAAQTLDAILAAAGAAPQVDKARRFYKADVRVWLQALHGLPDRAGHVLAVGHNPVLSELATWLSGDIVRLAPGDMCELGFAGSWQQLAPGAMQRLEQVQN